MGKEIGRSVRQIQNDIIGYFRRQPSLGVTRMQGWVIGYINCANKNVYQKDIEKEFCIGRSTATDLLVQMENVGLIERIPETHDKRLRRIVLLDKGIAIWDKMNQQKELLELKMKNGLTDEELDAFYVTVEKICANLRGWYDQKSII